MTLTADSRLKWQTFNGLGRQAFIHLCEENAVDYEGSNLKPGPVSSGRRLLASALNARAAANPSEHGR